MDENLFCIIWESWSPKTLSLQQSSGIDYQERELLRTKLRNDAMRNVITGADASTRIMLLHRRTNYKIPSTKSIYRSKRRHDPPLNASVVYCAFLSPHERAWLLSGLFLVDSWEWSRWMNHTPGLGPPTSDDIQIEMVYLYFPCQNPIPQVRRILLQGLYLVLGCI